MMAASRDGKESKTKEETGDKSWPCVQMCWDCLNKYSPSPHGGSPPCQGPLGDMCLEGRRPVLPDRGERVSPLSY